MEDNLAKLIETILNSLDKCLNYPNIFKNSHKESNYNEFISFLKSDINYIQQLIDRKRRIYVGNDILDYILNPGLVEPELVTSDERAEDPERELLQRHRQRVLAKLRAQVARLHATEKAQAEARRSKLCQPYKPNERQVLATKGNQLLVEPLRLEREELRKAKEDNENKKIEWEYLVAQVEPFLSEIKQYGEPRHRIQSQFWINLLGADICKQNISVFDELSKVSKIENEETQKEIEVADNMDSKLQRKERGNPNRVKNIHETRNLKKEEAEKKHLQDILATMNETERLQTAARWQREQETRQIQRRKEQLWQPQKANTRRILRHRFNNPPQKEPVKISKPAPRELTDLEKKQLYAKQQHKHEMEQMQSYNEKYYRPGQLNDISQLKIKNPRVEVPEDCEDKEFQLFAGRFIVRRQKQLVQKYKWRNVVYPRSDTFGLGLKIFPGFEPSPASVVMI